MPHHAIMSNTPSGPGVKTWLAVTLVTSAAAFALGYGLRPAEDRQSASSDPEAPHRSRSSIREDRAGMPRSKPDRIAAKPTSLAPDPSRPPFEPGQSREWLLQQVKLNGWKDDPSTFFRMVQLYSSMDEESTREMVDTIFALLPEWRAGKDPATAAIPKEWFGRLGLFPVMFRYAQLNPSAALDLVETQKLLKDNDEFYQVALSNLTAQDPDLALERVRGLQGNDLRNGLEPILGTLFATDVDRVIQILGENPGPEFDGERRKLAERLARQDPARAISYAQSAIQAGRNPDVLLSAVKGWQQIDKAAADRWIDTYSGPGAELLKDSPGSR